MLFVDIVDDKCQTSLNYGPPHRVELRPNAGQGLHILEVSRSHTTTHHSW